MNDSLAHERETDFPCPACGYLINNYACAYERCAICTWEDAPEQLRNPYLACAPNWVTLWDAQKNYIENGVSVPGREKSATIPLDSAKRDHSWRPIDPQKDDFGEQDLTFPLKWSCYETLYYWRDTFWNSKDR